MEVSETIAVVSNVIRYFTELTLLYFQKYRDSGQGKLSLPSFFKCNTAAVLAERSIRKP